MIVLIQRVKNAKVEVEKKTVAQIGKGILAFGAFEPEDGLEKAKKMAEKIISYRIFPDAENRMNLSLVEAEGELLLVPQFTLAAATKKGRRPSFTSAMPPEQAAQLFAEFASYCQSIYPKTQTGIFAADMQVHLINDGPVTFYFSL